MKKVVFGFLGLIALVGLAVAVGTFVPRPLFETQASTAPAGSTRILLLSNPIHSDIAIPLGVETRTAFGFLGGSGIPVADPGAEWLVIGWGGRSFYLETPTWADLKPMPVLRALTIDRSVMHVDVAGGIDEAHPAVMSLDVSAADFRRLLKFIDESFAETGGEVVAVPNAGYGGHDRFFEANGHFNAFVGCNTWTAAALRAAGLRTGLWNPLPQTLAVSLDVFN
ncbi:uncharacterized protein (TIGR02117 family) [Rhizobium subbaraonis]|uniref:Uncharacterized protein (TIGR02117 family) n=1 Tax=Rhizobium subbaraonis TaxID=908946 RepID=A0A285UT04_9HYPH|nr:TIGR02117 family protein [Rhizobium subbaraonis]SOC44952.1 uncharacterized protein (TIGR02117 family) [Rhizobium subbaraonis]